MDSMLQNKLYPLFNIDYICLRTLTLNSENKLHENIKTILILENSFTVWYITLL